MQYFTVPQLFKANILGFETGGLMHLDQAQYFSSACDKIRLVMNRELHLKNTVCKTMLSILLVPPQLTYQLCYICHAGVRTTTGGSASQFDIGNVDKLVTIPEGEQMATFSVPIMDDNEAEPQETFTIILSLVDGGELGTYSRLDVTIIDRIIDAPPRNGGRFLFL